VRDGEVWLAELGPPWEGVGLVRWQRIAIATESGLVALIDRPDPDVFDLWGAWEPVMSARDIDVEAHVAAWVGQEACSLLLQYELPVLPTRTHGLIGRQDPWQTVRSYSWNPENGERTAAPAWRNVTLAASLRWRLQFLAAGQPPRTIDLRP
jgi:hypothetical protein